MLAGVLQASQLLKHAATAAPGSLPLTIIAGFLGSGKTTLINRLLAAPHGRRIAVLVNDFGAINVDADLIRTRSADTMALSNGCVCCSLAGDLTRALIGLSQRDDPPDLVVLEASGVSDPRGIAQVALANPALRLDGILTLVDAETLPERLADPDTAPIVLAQLAVADIVVLNKLDLADAAQRDRARAWVAANGRGAAVVETAWAEVPADIVLGISGSGMWPTREVADVARAVDFRSSSATTGVLLDDERVKEFVTCLPESTLRAKAVFWLAGNPGCRTVFQRVGRRWSMEPGPPWAAERPQSSIVLIGPNAVIGPSELRQRLDACRASWCGDARHSVSMRSHEG